MTRSRASSAVVVFACLAVAVILGGCNPDPTDPSRVVAVKVVNDTSSEVTLNQCDVGCGTLHDKFTLKPGDTKIVHVSSASDVTSWYLLQEASGRTLGCLALKGATGTANASQATSACPR